MMKMYPERFGLTIRYEQSPTQMSMLTEELAEAWATLDVINKLRWFAIIGDSFQKGLLVEDLLGNIEVLMLTEKNLEPDIYPNEKAQARLAFEFLGRELTRLSNL